MGRRALTGWWTSCSTVTPPELLVTLMFVVGFLWLQLLVVWLAVKGNFEFKRIRREQTLNLRAGVERRHKQVNGVKSLYYIVQGKQSSFVCQPVGN